MEPKTIQWREQFVKKRVAQLKPILPWTKIYLVDGSAIRSLLDSDYDQGGNSFRYEWIPKNEIWIDDSVPEDELYYILLHESIESLYMAHGDSYDTAHDKAKYIEDTFRHKAVPQKELSPRFTSLSVRLKNILK